MELKVTTLAGKAAGSVTVADEVFALEPRADLLQRMVRYQLAKRQAGTHKTKGRSEIRGTSKKALRQKGSGAARKGNLKAPQMRGGGRAFGPVVRSHAHDLPKKVRVLALKHALSSKARDGALIVLDAAKTDDAKTKALKASLSGLGLNSALIVGGETVDENFAFAARNIPLIDVLPVQGINVYDILRRDTLVLTKDAVEALEARFK